MPWKCIESKKKFEAWDAKRHMGLNMHQDGDKEVNFLQSRSVLASMR